VMLSHLNLVSNMRSIAEYLNLSARDRIMMILPHFYIYGLSLVLTHTLVGGSIVLDNRFLYPNVILDTMKETEATGFAGVPSTFSILLSRSTLSDARFPALRYVTQAGGAMPPAVQKEVVEAFAPAQLFVMYGATEAAPRLTYVEPSMLPLKWGSIGKAIPNVEVFVADEAGNRLGTGIEGEIVARGSNITAGYWKDPEGSARVLKHGLYFTGDLGMEDADGYLYVTGRAKNILKVKGFRVSPKEIEEHLTEFDGITDAAVIGVPDEVLGEAPVAFLVTRGGIMVNSSNLKKFLQDRIASYKIPIEFIHRDDLPKNAAGKIDKKELLVLYKGGIE
ncbi:MAG: AMP-binding protein, partial [Spirochaetales bacterium]|nr:AMP-binding protein [Spirochaetales bacterium]